MFEKRFKIKEFFVPHMVHLCVPCGSYNARRLFRYTKLHYCWLLPRPGVFTARYELKLDVVFFRLRNEASTRVGTLIVPTIYLQLIQNRYMFRSFTLLEGTTSWHSLQNCSRDSSGGRPLHSNYQHNRRC